MNTDNLNEKLQTINAAGEELVQLNTNRGGDKGQIGFVVEITDTLDKNLGYIDKGQKTRQKVRNNNGDWDATTSYGRKLQYKIGTSFTAPYKLNEIINSGQYNNGVIVLDSNHPIFDPSNESKYSSVLDNCKRNNIKLRPSDTSVDTSVRLTRARKIEGDIRTSVGLDPKAPIVTKAYTTARKGEVILKEVGREAVETTRTAADGAGAAMIGAAPAIIHQSAKDVKKVIDGDMEVTDAVLEIATITGTVATSGAATAIANRAANKVATKVLNKTIDANSVGKIVGLAISLKGCTEKYINGEIESGEYLHEVLEDGVGFAVSSIGWIVGDLVGGPVAGACVSYVLGEVYDTIIGAIREERFSKNRKNELIRVAEQIKKEEEKYREEFKKKFAEYYGEQSSDIDIAFNEIAYSMKNNNVEIFLSSINDIARVYGVEYAWTLDEIDKKMNDETYTFMF